MLENWEPRVKPKEGGWRIHNLNKDISVSLLMILCPTVACPPPITQSDLPSPPWQYLGKDLEGMGIDQPLTCLEWRQVYWRAWPALPVSQRLIITPLTHSLRYTKHLCAQVFTLYRNIFTFLLPPIFTPSHSPDPLFLNSAAWGNRLQNTL